VTPRVAASLVVAGWVLLVVAAVLYLDGRAGLVVAGTGLVAFGLLTPFRGE
jgi:hypothetical protein